MEQQLLEISPDMINRSTGHARFRRSTPAAAAAAPTILDFSKASVEVERDYLSLSLSQPDYTLPSSSTTTTTNSSSITADGSVSNTHHIMKPPPPPPPPQCQHPDTHYHPSSSGNKLKSFSSGKSSRCHCTKEIRKRRVKAMIRVPAISSKAAEIPADEYSWRKYGQKPIKGSSFPRAYYKCSTFRGCPARKHVERAIDDPEMLIVTYQGQHRHDQGSSLSLLPLGQSQH